ncbi:RICIN domain-containing protein [Streptomyces sp. NPDC051172]|uniref:RICIN domain-containing protein n=1 Tax=Streptomyces sp. NPDC051172 TaxID=3155796 RepID=UPI0034209219
MARAPAPSPPWKSPRQRIPLQGTTLQQRTRNGDNNQLWYFEPLNGGWVIRDFESKQAVEVAGGSTIAGADIDRRTALDQPDLDDPVTR